MLHGALLKGAIDPANNGLVGDNKVIKNYMMRRRDRQAEPAIEFQARRNSSVPTPISTGLFASAAKAGQYRHI